MAGPYSNSTFNFFIFIFKILFIYLFWLHRVAFRILIPQPGIEPVPPAVEGRRLNHWTPREVPRLTFYLFIYSLLCVGFLYLRQQGLLFIVVHGLLILVASLAVEYGL